MTRPPARRVFRAPGRANLIGEHTDYTGGYVLPVAIGLACEARAARRGDGVVRFRSLDAPGIEAVSPVGALAAAEPRGDWSDYPVGVARELAWMGVAIPALDIEFVSAVPIGAGLSSSAALEVAAALALSAWEGPPVPDEALARACQRAESEFVGLRCGPMDQFASVFGRRGRALLLDCRSLEWRLVPAPPGLEVVIVDSGVKHALASSAYNRRRLECEQAATAAGRPLRDFTVAEWAAIEPSIPEPLRRRGRHVVGENARVLDFVAASEAGDERRLGELMAASQRSLASDFEVSCPELDFLVETAAALPGVAGARMTGGGFGGSTVNLVRPDAVEAFGREIATAYRAAFGREARVFDCSSADGAHEVGAAAGDVKLR